MEVFSSELLWIVIVGFIVSAILAFGVGANDVANSFGTSVGSQVLTLKLACLLATIFEVAGAVLIGYKVSDTMRKGIIDVTIYKDSEMELMLGSLASLGGSAIWLLVATYFKLPISGTHSIVGATVGFSLVARGVDGVGWTTLGKIIASWFISPVLSGMISSLIFAGIRYFVLNKEKPLEPGLRLLPFFYFFTVFVNVVSVVVDGPKLLKFDEIPVWIAVIASFVVAVIVGVVVYVIVVPKQRKKAENLKDAVLDEPPNYTWTAANSDTVASHSEIVLKSVVEDEGALGMNGTANGTVKTTEQALNGNEAIKLTEANGDVENAREHCNGRMVSNTNSETALVFLDQGGGDGFVERVLDPKDEDRPDVKSLFSFLQILTASFGSFAHGGNDVSNAVGPLVAIWLIYQEGSVLQKSETPIYILAFGGVGIALGLWIWGRRVIQTVGTDLTKITPSSGFTIELGSALTVLTASKIGLPVSTTHCKVGSVVFVGWVKRTKVDWKLFTNIVLAWIVTLPVSGGLSALLMFILSKAAL